jgi:Ala-tRNA(Pro) deacylase
MAVIRTLSQLLEQTKTKHKVIEHRKVFTAFDATQTQRLKTSEVAKAVLVKGKKELYMAVLPAGTNCDLKALGKLASDKLSMAKEKDIKVKLKTKVGLLAPFGSIYKIPVFLDKKLAKNKKLRLPAGSYTESVELSLKDYIKLESPVLGNFSKKK